MVVKLIPSGHFFVESAKEVQATMSRYLAMNDLAYFQYVRVYQRNLPKRLVFEKLISLSEKKQL